MSALSACAAAAAALLALGGCEQDAHRPAPGELRASLAAQAAAFETSETPPAPEPAGAPGIAFAGQLTQGGWIRGQMPPGTVRATLGESELALDEDGHFFAAFDRDAGGTLVLQAHMAEGTVVAQEIAIAPRAWDIEHVDVARRPGRSSAAFLARRRPELEAIWNARAKHTGAQGWRQDFIWPVKGRISGRFGAQRIYRGEPGSYHSGLDIAPGAGTPFVAPADGVVVLAAEDFSLEGKLLIIDHGQGLNSAFLHAARLLVQEGDRVEQGQVIGHVGASGRATGPHLHWSLKWRDARLDPLLFVPPQ